jgi:hypothetical protein
VPDGTYAVQFLNPLTRQIADLPSATTLFDSRLREERMDGARPRRRLHGSAPVPRLFPSRHQARRREVDDASCQLQDKFILAFRRALLLRNLRRHLGAGHYCRSWC